MVIFWSIAPLLVGVTVLSLLWPLLRPQRREVAPDTDAAAIALYLDQKRALDAESADGVITPAECDAAVAELARRLGEELALPAAAAGARSPRRAWVFALALLLLIPSAAFVLYARLGSPDAAAVAADEAATPHEMSASQIAAIVDNLARRLNSHPDDAEGWLLLARSYASLGRFADAADAYARADALVPDNADLLADYAEVLAVAQGKRLAGKPTELVQRALAIDPQHTKALALAASAAMEAHDLDRASSYWRRLLAQVPQGSDDAKKITAIVAEIESAKGGNGAVAATKARAAAQPNQAPIASGPAGASIAGRVDIAPALAGKVSLTDTVFIFARAVDGPRMPLAVLRVAARELPREFKLDDSMGMASGMKLSTAPAVIVEARVSKSGNALPQSGDLRGTSEPVKPGARGVKITIDEVLP